MESSGEQTERLIAQSATSANAAKDNAIAAKLTAEASERSVKALIGKERARIRVEPHKLKLVKPDEYTLQEVSFALEVIGTTPAFIVESTATAFISRSEEPSNWKLNLPMGLSAILKPSATLRTALIWDALHNDGTFEEIRDGIAFVHFYGRIEYVDVFDEKRVTSFRYVWKYFDSPLGVLRKTTGERSGYWLTCGEPEDNKQT
jgi:hypothetical protein